MPRNIIFILLFVAAAHSQPAITLTAPAAATGDGKNATVIPLSISVTGTPGQNLSAVEWQVSMPAGVAIVQNGATATAMTQGIAKNVVCGTDVAASGCPPTYQGVGNCGFSVCIVVGMTNGAVSNQPFTSDGAIATIPVSIPTTQSAGNLQFGVTNTLGVDTSGNSVVIGPGAAGSTPVTVKYSAPNYCDVNGDGSVNYSDSLAVLLAIVNPSSTTCPLKGYSCTLQNLMSVIVAEGGAACVLH